MALSPRAARRSRRLGPLFRRRAARPLAQRGRPVGDRRAARPHLPLARRRRRADAGAACARSSRAIDGAARRRGRRPRGRLHVLPDFHGNRSPLADPHALGVISGLTLDASFDSLCRLYWRTCVGDRARRAPHPRDAERAAAIVIDTLHVTGGHTRNPLLMELYADATGCTVVEPLADDAVLLGTAHGGRRPAPGCYPDLAAACAAMQQGGRTRAARPGGVRRASTATTASSSRCTGSGRRSTPSGSAASLPAQATTVSRRRRSSSDDDDEAARHDQQDAGERQRVRELRRTRPGPRSPPRR